VNRLPLKGISRNTRARPTDEDFSPLVAKRGDPRPPWVIQAENERWDAIFRRLEDPGYYIRRRLPQYCSPTAA
jgi:hypothetical protein